MNYADFLHNKLATAPPKGVDTTINSPHLFDWQARVTEWALQRGRAAIFADTGLGKTRMLLAWADTIANHTNGSVLVLAPLGVVQQTIREGEIMGIAATAHTPSRITITNYDRLHQQDPSAFTGVVLDESSRIKSYDSRTRDQVIDAFSETPYRLACTATPAPNDHMELGNHAEFLGVMTRAQMLAMYFVHDGSRTSNWRLKGHAKHEFWRWVASWAIAMKHPRDLGYEADGYDLPELQVIEHPVTSEPTDGSLFGLAVSLTEQRHARRDSLQTRVRTAADLITPGEPWVVWCELNDESQALARMIPGSIELTGSDPIDVKEDKLRAFTDEGGVLITKPSIAGFGMNWQHCARTTFCGVGHSFEQYYQAIRRFHRFGQERSVHAHLIYSEAEIPVVQNLRRKEAEAADMADHMVRLMSEHNSLAKPEPSEPPAPAIPMEVPSWLPS